MGLGIVIIDWGLPITDLGFGVEDWGLSVPRVFSRFSDGDGSVLLAL